MGNGKFVRSFLTFPISAMGQNRKSSLGHGMSAPEGEADETGAKADIQTTPDSQACYSVNASLWFDGLRPRYV